MPNNAPNSDDWRNVTLAYLDKSGTRLWVGCEGCQHSVKVTANEFSQNHKLPLNTPLLILARSLVCSKCRARKGFAWPEPYTGR